MDAPPEARQADLGQYLVRNGNDGAAVVDRLDSDDLDTFLDQSPSTRVALTRVDSGDNGFDAAHFIRNTDAEDRAVLDRLDGPTQTRLYLRYGEGDLDASNLRRIDELIESGDMDQADVQRLLGILETKNRDPFVGDGIDSEDLLNIVDKGADLSETRVVTKPDNIFEFGNAGGETPDTLLLENGDVDEGWTHIRQRHVTDTQIDAQGRTSYFPAGQTIKGRTLDGPMESDTDVQRLITRAVENGDPQQGSRRTVAEYRYSPDPETTGVSDMTVRVTSNGRIIGVFPEEGPNVRVWIRDQNDWLDNIR
ncbi:hypothetical protein [Haloarcula brevis]|uniref:hypothetical protein n=1 Tax=Haloarcula brevis TaxID=3111453 RepID=UPI00300F7950